jgi:hypothetical protein
MNNFTQISWKDFIDILRKEDIVIQVEDRLYFSKELRINDDLIRFIWEGVYKKEFNETITVENDIYNLKFQIFDEVETGEVEEYEGMYGEINSRPLTKKLETYKLIERKFKIYSLYKNGLMAAMVHASV